MSSTILESYDHWLEQEKMPAGKKKSTKAAIQLFAKQGFNGTSTVDIAEMAGVSQATIFKYFKTKEELLTQITMPILPQIFHDFYHRLSQYQNLDDIIEFVIHDRFSFISNNQIILKIIFQEALINESFRLEIMSRMMSHDIGSQMINFLDYLKKKNPQMNQELSPDEILRIFIGPMLAYLSQRFILGMNSIDEEHDLQLIKHQIITNLLLK